MFLLSKTFSSLKNPVQLFFLSIWKLSSLLVLVVAVFVQRFIQRNDSAALFTIKSLMKHADSKTHSFLFSSIQLHFTSTPHEQFSTSAVKIDFDHSVSPQMLVQLLHTQEFYQTTVIVRVKSSCSKHTVLHPCCASLPPFQIRARACCCIFFLTRHL